MPAHPLSFVDQAICQFDRALRTLSPGPRHTTRPAPTPTHDTVEELSEHEQRHAAGLMRVNHAGEVCAQALYQGQALTAKLPKVRAKMEQAADEEVDHLAWCEHRLEQLHSHPSVLNPAWYGLSFGLGATAGLLSDRISLGFVAATEDQVCRHLESHLKRLPEQDHASRAIVEQMLEDEAKHAHTALMAGGYRFPRPVKTLMNVVSKMMTESSYRV